MNLRFVSILLLVSSLYGGDCLKIKSFNEACCQRVISSERPPLAQRISTLWGIKKKLNRWDKVIQSAERATRYSVDCATLACEEQYTVRVLIAEHTISKDSCSWEFMSVGGFLVVDEDEKNNTYLISKPMVTISYKNGYFSLNGKRLRGSRVRIIPEQSVITLDGVTYRGDFVCTRYKERIVCINCIELESYVGSVLSSESWPGWPLEVNKVFAVMSRSYVLSHMLAAQKAGRPYHVRNTNSHQNYHGVHTNTIIEDAVAQTAGVCLVYENRPVLAMFDACCGGVIPAHIAHGIDFKKEPYLARAYACTYCKKYYLYNWEKTLSLQEIEEKLRIAQLCDAAINEIRVVSRDKAGLAKTVHIKTKRGVVTCRGKQIYSAIPEVKSYAFDFGQRGHNVTITGYGHGHHLGVCQWGAREMVRLGYTYQQILCFYYPGTMLRSIK